MTDRHAMDGAETLHGSARVRISGSPTQVIRIVGDVDLANVHQIDRRISTAYGPDVDGVVVDLSGTTYLDSAGLAMLVRISSRLAAARTAMTVIAPPDSAARRVIELSGLAGELALRNEPRPGDDRAT